MGFQKCPICNGLGHTPNLEIAYTSTNKQCHVCKGHGIISEVTGLPPSYGEATEDINKKSESLVDKLNRVGSKIWRTEPQPTGEPGNLDARVVSGEDLPFNTEVHNDMFRTMKKFKENNIKMWEMEHDGTFDRKHSTHTSSDGLTPVEIELVHKTGFTWMGKCEKIPGVVIYRNSKLRVIDDLELKLKTKGYKIGSITVIKN